MTLIFASRIDGFFENLFCNKCSACSRGRPNSQQIRPRANMFLHRSMALLSSSVPARELFTIEVIATGTSCWVMPNSLKGSSVLNAAFSRSLFSNESVSKRMTPFDLTYFTFVFRAAGFMATNTSALSPGVYTPFPMCTWNPDTPPRVPCGARISAG